MGKNAVLQRHAESAMAVARAQSEASGRTEHVYTDTRYAAGTWGHERRVVIKAEVVRLKGREPRDNPRFVVTNLLRSSRFVYEWVYCARGDIENRIKELLDGLQIDRTSCCKFLANQLRVLLTAAGLRTHAGAAAAGGADRLCPHPGDVAARSAAEAGGACRRLRAPHRPASTTGDAPSPRVAAHRPCAWRPRGLVRARARLGARLGPGRHRPSRQNLPPTWPPRPPGAVKATLRLLPRPPPCPRGSARGPAGPVGD